MVLPFVECLTRSRQGLSTDNDPLFHFKQWQTNLRVYEINEIKSIPFTPQSHPYIDAHHWDSTTVSTLIIVIRGTFTTYRKNQTHSNTTLLLPWCWLSLQDTLTVINEPIHRKYGYQTTADNSIRLLLPFLPALRGFDFTFNPPTAPSQISAIKKPIENNRLS